MKYGNMMDLDKTKLFLKTVRNVQPDLYDIWIISARFEARLGNIEQARCIIKEGCEFNLTREELWLEAARLEPPETIKSLLIQALWHNPSSAELWKKRVDLEKDEYKKKDLYQKALLRSPNSVDIWKAAIELETPEDARILLNRLLDRFPTCEEIYIALARLETPKNARIVLTNALKKIPTEKKIWITAAKLEEAHDKAHKVKNIIDRAISYIRMKNAVLNRKHWFKEAIEAEKEGAVECCRYIVKATMDFEVKEKKRINTWVKDAETFAKEKALECGRAIYENAMELFSKKQSIYIYAVNFEKTYGTQEHLTKILQRAVVHCSKSEILWLMKANLKLLNGDIDGFKWVMSNAFLRNPNSKQISLAIRRRHFVNSEYAQTQRFIKKAEKECKPLKEKTQKEIVKSVKWEWGCDRLDRALDLLEESLEVFADFYKLWIMKVKIEEQQGHLDKAIETCYQGIKKCPNSIPLWRLLAQLYYKKNQVDKTRLILDEARQKNPKNAELWLESILTELKSDGGRDKAHELMIEALEECPKSGLLWAQAIFMVKKPQQRTTTLNALTKCGDDEHVFLAVSKLLWCKRKIYKCRYWFNCTVEHNPYFGDGWAYFYKFELLHGKKAQQENVMNRCIAARPRFGENWCKVSKNIKYWCLSIDEILQLAAKELPIPKI